MRDVADGTADYNRQQSEDKELQQKIISIDKKRARYYQFYTEQDWGNKANYDLCINTTNTEIKKIVAAIEKFIV